MGFLPQQLCWSQLGSVLELQTSDRPKAVAHVSVRRHWLSARASHSPPHGLSYLPGLNGSLPWWWECSQTTEPQRESAYWAPVYITCADGLLAKAGHRQVPGSHLSVHPWQSNGHRVYLWNTKKDILQGPHSTYTLKFQSWPLKWPKSSPRRLTGCFDLANFFHARESSCSIETNECPLLSVSSSLTKSKPEGQKMEIKHLVLVYIFLSQMQARNFALSVARIALHQSLTLEESSNHIRVANPTVSSGQPMS